MSSYADRSISLLSQSARQPRRDDAGLLRRWLDKILLEIEVRRALRQISAFDDMMLHDIGLDRGGLEYSLRHGTPERE